MIKQKWILHIYIITIIVIGFILIGIYISQVNFSRDFFFYLVLSVFAESLPVKLPWKDVTISIGFPINFAAILSLGSPDAVLIGFLTLILVNFRKIKPETPIYKMLFNSSQLAISIALGGIVFYNLGGNLSRLNIVQNLIPLFLSIVTYFIANSILLSTVVSISSGAPFIEIWNTLAKNFAINYLSLSSIGILIAMVQIRFGWLPVFLFLIPLLLARYSFKLYVEVKKLYKSTILALAQAVDAKDPYTKGHSDRVSKYAEKIGEKIGLSAGEMEDLIFSAILHDIGKIGIPDNILKKTSKLTPKEYEIIKTHPIEGEKIISKIPYLKNMGKIIRAHHEKIDGTGYPDGMKNGEIPEFSKIIAVCDSYDAMTSDRPYRKALSKEEAIKELKKYAGTQFDKKYVNILIEILEKESE